MYTHIQIYLKGVGKRYFCIYWDTIIGKKLLLNQLQNQGWLLYFCYTKVNSHCNIKVQICIGKLFETFDICWVLQLWADCVTHCKALYVLL